MGFDALRWAFEQRTGNGHANAVLFHLANRVQQLDPVTRIKNPDWTITCRRDDIVKAVEFSVSTVRRSLLYLRENGFIEWQELADGTYLFRLLQRIPTERGPVPQERSAVPIGHEARSARTLYKEPGAETKKSQESPLAPPGAAVDVAVTLFNEAFEKHYGMRPLFRTADFVHMARLRKHLGIAARAAPEDFSRALTHFFATPRALHTLADLCVNYATFRLNPLDQYQKPIVAGGNNGKGSFAVSPAESW
jgi:hypothetical protein